uniref:Uncharacterized protein n=1 Tax=Arundo donax TaxID=35708 RepID=A0A0A9CVW5_ARUDO
MIKRFIRSLTMMILLTITTMILMKARLVKVSPLRNALMRELVIQTYEKQASQVIVLMVHPRLQKNKIIQQTPKT